MRSTFLDYLELISSYFYRGAPAITMYETLIRPQQVDAVPALSPIGEISAKLKKAEQRREEKRLRQIANSRAARKSASEGKRKRDNTTMQASEEVDVPVEKKPKTEEEAQEAEPKASESGERAGLSEVTAMELEVESESADMQQEELPQTAVAPCTEESLLHLDEQPAKISVSKTFPEVRGHTSYLTFACLLPSFVTDTQSTEEQIGQQSSDTM